MPRPIAQLKEHLLANCLRAPSNSDPSTFFAIDDKDEISLKCFLRAIRVDNQAGLLARVTYHFPRGMTVAVNDAFHYAEVLNHLLIDARVFVVQDIDGDCRYALRIDAVLQGRYDKTSISQFLDKLTQNVELLLSYFHYHRPGQQFQMQMPIARAAYRESLKPLSKLEGNY